MNEQVQVGIIGTSWWTDMMLLPSLTSHSRARVTAICGRNHERAQEMADKYDVPTVYTDYHELIEKGGLDALVVAAPDDLHHPMTMAALDAGLHVLCEKPMASNAQQAREMLDKAEAAGVKHMVLFTWRWMPHFQYLHGLVEDGYIGRPFHAQFSFQGGYARDDDYAWRFDWQRANGIVGDLGSHMIDLARWFVGDVVKVSANLATFVERQGIDGQPLDPANDSAVVSLEFANGAQGTVQASAVANIGDRGMKQHIDLYGEAGALQADVIFFGSESGAILRGVQGDDEPVQMLTVPDEFWGDVDRSDFTDAMVPGVFEKQSAGPRLFIEAILEDKPLSPNFYDGYKVVEVVDAALKSAETGCVVAIGS
jgi:predicted dehydrogenase